MHKMLGILFCFFVSTVALAENVGIVNNSNYAMTVHYQVCPLNLKNKSTYNCEGISVEEIKIGTKLTSKHYVSIPIYDMYWYVKIIDAVEKENEVVKAQGDFHLHMCNGFNDRKIILDDYGTPYVMCLGET